MNRLFLIALAVICAAALLGLLVSEHPGYVLVSYRGFLYEAGLWSTLVLLLLVMLTFYGIRLLLRGATTSGGLINPWSSRHRARRMDQAARLGLVDLAEGRWQEALRHLRRAAAADRQPLVLYLGAARAANELGQYEESDAFLEQALAAEPRAGIAVGLARTRLLIDRGQLQEALQTIRGLHVEHPQHPQVLKLEQRLLVELRLRLKRHEAHGWSRRRLSDRLRVAVVVLLRLHVGLDVFGRHQPHLVALRRERPTQVMRPAARLHRHDARRLPRQERLKPVTGKAAAQHHGALVVQSCQAAAVLAEVDPDSSRWSSPAPISWHAPPTLRDPSTEGRAIP